MTEEREIDPYEVNDLFDYVDAMMRSDWPSHEVAVTLLALGYTSPEKTDEGWVNPANFQLVIDQIYTATRKLVERADKAEAAIARVEAQVTKWEESSRVPLPGSIRDYEALHAKQIRMAFAEEGEDGG